MGSLSGGGQLLAPHLPPRGEAAARSARVRGADLLGGRHGIDGRRALEQGDSHGTVDAKSVSLSADALADCLARLSSA